MRTKLSMSHPQSSWRTHALAEYPQGASSAVPLPAEKVPGAGQPDDGTFKSPGVDAIS